jgi:hypothetical protein
MSVDIREAIQKTSSDPAALAGLALRAGVPRRAISRLIAEQPVNASDYLNVCGALGLDPVSGQARAPANGFDVQFWFFAYGLKGTRIIRKLSVRETAKLAGLSIATISRAEAGRPISAANYFALCSFIGLHPHHYAHRFTGNVQCNSLAACGFRRLRPGIPIERGHAFRSKAATCSDEGGRVVAGMVS